MQSLYVAGIMKKCPIKQGVCPSDIKHAAIVYGWEFAEEWCQAVIRKVINAVFVYFWAYNFTKYLLKGTHGCQ